ncbi:MAG: metallophosphoesterase family protein [Candidatus Aminicenantes bacterium]|nr:metallophosphoesterase family protein [Candidatus Aminicenantes bacterium]
MNSEWIIKRLTKLAATAPRKKISNRNKLVIFSDLHMGGGGKKDDFVSNSDLLIYILEHYYEKKDFTLVLNGDVEELQRFSFNKITGRWKKVFEIFSRFSKRKALLKTYGNHDYELCCKKNYPAAIPVTEGLTFQYGEINILIFHGHQALRYPEFFYLFSTLVLRLVANPLGIKNYSVAYNSRKRYRVERRVYHFAKQKKIIAIIGHTHRPLFESLSKLDSLKFKIEQLCRLYPKAPSKRKLVLKKKIISLKKTLLDLLKNGKKDHIKKQSSLYDSELLVPCIFNSGCVIGKRGLTAIEISEGKIRLVYWFDRNITQKDAGLNKYFPRQLGRSDYFRLVLDQEDLNYILTRVRLLS